MKVMLEQGAFAPERAHRSDAGLDLRSPFDVKIPAFGSATIDTGVHIELPVSFAGVIISKSGLNVNHNITSTGLIDEGYTGSIRVKLYNHSDLPYSVKRGDKITQLVVVPVTAPSIELVPELSKTERGNNGFGSTGR